MLLINDEPDLYLSCVRHISAFQKNMLYSKLKISTIRLV